MDGRRLTRLMRRGRPRSPATIAGHGCASVWSSSNPTVGDLDGNASRLFDAVSGAPPGVDFFVTSEMALTGYPARDLLLQHALHRSGRTRRRRRWPTRLANAPPVLVGLPLKNPARAGRPLLNAAALARKAAASTRRFVKSLLPTYDVFDEDRYFEPGEGLQVVRLGDLTRGGQRLRRRLERSRLLEPARATTSIRSRT